MNKYVLEGKLVGLVLLQPVWEFEFVLVLLTHFGVDGAWTALLDVFGNFFLGVGLISLFFEVGFDLDFACHGWVDAWLVSQVRHNREQLDLWIRCQRPSAFCSH